MCVLADDVLIHETVESEGKVKHGKCGLSRSTVAPRHRRASMNATTKRSCGPDPVFLIGPVAYLRSQQVMRHVSPVEAMWFGTTQPAGLRKMRVVHVVGGSGSKDVLFFTFCFATLHACQIYHVRVPTTRCLPGHPDIVRSFFSSSWMLGVSTVVELSDVLRSRDVAAIPVRVGWGLWLGVVLDCRGTGCRDFGD